MNSIILLTLFSILISIYLTGCVDGVLLKPIVITIVFGLIDKNITDLGLIIWALFGYICGILYIIDYNILSSMLVVLILALSFYTTYAKLATYTTSRIMSFAITFLLTLLLKI